MSNILNNVERYAYAYARGKDSFGDMFVDSFNAQMTGNEALDETMPRELYTKVRTRAEVIANMAHKPLKEQSDKSRNSQISKLANAFTLGEIARVHNEHVAEAFETAIRKTGTGYTKLVKCAVAMKDVLAKSANRASLDDLLTAIEGALVTEPTPASAAVQKLANQWEKLVHGTDEEPSPYQPAFSALLQAYPQDFAETVSANLAAIVKIFERLEGDAEVITAISKAK